MSNNYERQRRETAIMKKIIVVIILFMSLVSVGCARRDPKLAIHFNQIRVGDSRGRLIEIMGQPKEREYSDLLGLSKETLTWCFDDDKYESILINGYVIAKKSAVTKSTRCR